VCDGDDDCYDKQDEKVIKSHFFGS
jgi:hypothetical protein